jgi:thiol:disulfide interchange protein
VPNASDDLPRGLVFSSLRDRPTRRRRILAFVAVVVVAGLALVWPVYPSVASIRPYVLGLPFSMAWVVGWLAVVFVALVLLYRADELDSDA